MTIDFPAPDEQVRLAKAYVARVDAGDPELLHMLAGDVRAYFPKFGTMHGKAQLMRLVQALTGAVPPFVHDQGSMTFTQSGDRLVVEGTEQGMLADGTLQPAGARSEGRYCDVFEFRGPLISRLYIYTDPDFADRDQGVFARP